VPRTTKKLFSTRRRAEQRAHEREPDRPVLAGEQVGRPADNRQQRGIDGLTYGVSLRRAACSVSRQYLSQQVREDEGLAGLPRAALRQLILAICY
jgi:hypothetical protein